MEQPTKHPAGTGWKIFLFLAVVLVTGAILAPLLFKLGRWYADVADSFRQQHTPVLGNLAELCRDAPFDRYFNRAMLLAMLVWLWPFAKWLGVGKGATGLVKNTFRVQDVLIGFIMASSMLLAMGAVYVTSGYYVSKESIRQKALEKEAKAKPLPNDTTAAPTKAVSPPRKVPAPVSLGKVLLEATVAALAVALLEEWLFRGILLGLLLRSYKSWQAVLALSAFFAILHLLQPPVGHQVPDGAVTLTSGFQLVGLILAKFTHASTLAMEFSTLFIVGLLLAWARVRTKSLWLPIGLHAGWVFALKFFTGITEWNRKAHAVGSMDPWLGHDLRVGLVPLFVLTFTGLLLWGWFKAREKAIEYAHKFKSV